MKDTWNPTSDEIRDWASDSASLEPEQDWDLCLSHLPYDKLYVEFAADSGCPKQDYFLRLLYLIVGNAVRSSFAAESKGRIKSLLHLARSQSGQALFLFSQRSEELLAEPESFEYDDWCAGGIVAKDMAEPEGARYRRWRGET